MLLFFVCVSTILLTTTATTRDLDDVRWSAGITISPLNRTIPVDDGLDENFGNCFSYNAADSNSEFLTSVIVANSQPYDQDMMVKYTITVFGRKIDHVSVTNLEQQKAYCYETEFLEGKQDEEGNDVTFYMGVNEGQMFRVKIEVFVVGEIAH